MTIHEKVEEAVEVDIEDGVHRMNSLSEGMIVVAGPTALMEGREQVRISLHGTGEPVMTEGGEEVGRAAEWTSTTASIPVEDAVKLGEALVQMADEEAEQLFGEIEDDE